MQTSPEQTLTQSHPGFVSDYLLYLLAAASDAASAQFHAKVRAAGLRVPEWRVLACLLDDDGAMITKLAGIALAEQSRLTRIILQMETRGLVARRGDAADKRRVRVYLTDAGRALARDLVAEARVHEAALIQSLSGGDGARLKPALRSLLEVLAQDNPGDSASGRAKKTGSQAMKNMD
ncbi:Organic hydroperoxide resistance transcriptional regulator [Sulfitobacter sp. THAF37]|uniref:MarR family winged helix-turn-helix transcriptional regulator n=1 Tax=Sulfitobacter sp. THAF37 TaxID=2587855 RepID=UPI001269698E|nr:MarR family winged helix-turn-helix transcriptional regulator [Sulfitobacter sp. THAF37]QFT58823.1 Organic hydroperoxide resistance transcriptional regulator [Sulfitobacter sp. THAF37]